MSAAVFRANHRRDSLRSRLTSRLVAGIVTALSTELRAVSRVAAAAGVSWTTVMRVTADTAVLDGGVDNRRLVRRLGVDEHRFRRVRYLKDDVGKVTRVEPWSIVFTDLDPGPAAVVAEQGGTGGDGYVHRVPPGYP